MAVDGQKRKKTGGRKKGTPNKLKSEARIAELAKSGIMPLDYMLGIMRDPNQPAQRRDAMATRAIPYCSSALASIKVTNPHLPIAQLMAGMNADELAAFEVLLRGVAARLQPRPDAIGYSGGTGEASSGI